MATIDKKANQFAITNSIAIAVSTFTNPFILIALVFGLVNLNYLINHLDNFLIFLVVGFIPTLIHYISLINRHKTHLLHFVSLGREERDNLYLFMIFSFLFAFFIFLYQNDLFWIQYTILFSLIAISAYLINKFIDKISLHALAYTFSTFYLADKLSLGFSFALVFLPFIYWARIKLHKHTWEQLMLGTVLGMVFGLFSWLIR